ncbi:response regulator transcription factor, partial [Vibrio parahaemolyticus]|nr:response regulator transcription factor [Vibrio parahaemolyticus]
MDKPISVVIVDDHQVVLDGFMARLELEPDIEVVGTASNGLEAIEVAKHLQPDVILMDISMPIMNGIEATGVIKEARPESKILMLTMH